MVKFREITYNIIYETCSAVWRQIQYKIWKYGVYLKILLREGVEIILR